MSENPKIDKYKDDIKNIVIVGGGTMGRGIALAAAKRDIKVLLVEIDEPSLEQTMREVTAHLDRDIERWAITEGEQKSILSKIEGEVGFRSVYDQKYILEAAPENFDLKKDIFIELCNQCDPDSIFITNTSTLSITELASLTSRPDRFIGMHFLNPVEKVKLVEVVRGLNTSVDTFLKTKALAEKLERTAIEVFESPGYVTTRVIMPLVNEAIQVLMEGIASADDIDKAIQIGYEFSNGPLTMADNIGLDMVLKWLETLFKDIGDSKYRPCPLLRMLVRAGHLGAKTGQGFFKYDDNGVKIPGSGYTAISFDRLFTSEK